MRLDESALKLAAWRPGDTTPAGAGTAPAEWTSSLLAMLGPLLQSMLGQPAPVQPGADMLARLLSPPPGSYVVGHGDTLSQLAQRCASSVDELMRLNPQIRNADRIYAGQVLRLPGAPQPPAARSSGAAPVAPQRGAQSPGAAAAATVPAQGGHMMAPADAGQVDALRARYGDKAPQVAAFLRMLRCAEGTEGQTDPYRVVYGYGHELQDLSNHPKLTGEWTGKRLSTEMSKRAGLSGAGVSTAAVAYQITGSTFKDLQGDARLKAFGALPAGEGAFGRVAQDRMACVLLERSGAMDRLLSGDVEGAIGKASGTWASLPGNSYGQRPKSLDTVVGYFRESRQHQQASRREGASA